MAGVFAGIVIIEAVILVPSYLRLEDGLFDDIEGLARALVVTTVAATGETHHESQIHAKALLEAPSVKGVAMTDAGGDLVVAGEPPELKIGPTGGAVWRFRRSADGERYDVAWRAVDDSSHQGIVLRMDSSHVNAELVAFVWRIAGFVLVIAAFVTLITMVVVGRLVLRPLLELRQRLLDDWTNPSDAVLPESGLSRTDELGDVFRAVDALLGRIGNQIREVEERVDERSRELRESEAHMQAIVETIVDAIVTIDAKGIVMHVNPATERIFGHGRDDLVGRNINILMPAPYHEQHDSYLHRYLETGERRVIGVGRETVGRRKDGSTFPLYLAVSELHLDERRLFTGIMRDISDRKRAEQALQQSEGRMRAVMESALDCIIGIDAEGIIIEFNPAAEKVFGYSRDTAIGREMADMIVPPETRSAHRQGMKTFLETGEGPVLGNRIEVAAMRSDGSQFPIELAISVVEGDAGPVFIAYLRDISERKGNELALRSARIRAEEANRAKSDFLAMMSHEIRTPLNGVLGLLGLLRDTPVNEEQRNFVDTARNSAEILLVIINDVLDFSKMEAGKLELEIAPFDLAHIVESTADTLAAAAASKGIAVYSWVVPGTPRYLLGDAGRIRQILLNLVGNAVKFTQEGSVTIDVSMTKHEPPYVALRFDVIDTGIGIPEDRQSDIFNEFTTVDGSYSRKFEGTGLGLAISQRLVKMMGGEIDFASAPDEGSTFRFALELEEAPAGTAVAEPIATELIPTAGNRNLRILLAEDNPTNRMVAKIMLEKAGHWIDVAANGSEAVQAIRAFPYDMVLMDVSMPEMDGIEATSIIRTLPDGKADIPIIAMTAHAMRGDRERILAAGMNDYVSKPATRDQLLAAIARCVSDDKVYMPEPPAEPTLEVAAIFEEAALRRLADETDPIVVPELIESYLTDSKERLDRIVDALASSDLDTLEHETHTLGSSSATFGALRLHYLCRAIEAACQDGDTWRALEMAKTIPDIAETSWTTLSKYLRDVAEPAASD